MANGTMDPELLRKFLLGQFGPGAAGMVNPAAPPQAMGMPTPGMVEQGAPAAPPPAAPVREPLGPRQFDFTNPLEGVGGALVGALPEWLYTPRERGNVPGPRAYPAAAGGGGAGGAQAAEGAPRQQPRRPITPTPQRTPRRPGAVPRPKPDVGAAAEGRAAAAAVPVPGGAGDLSAALQGVQQMQGAPQQRLDTPPPPRPAPPSGNYLRTLLGLDQAQPGNRLQELMLSQLLTRGGR